jgi:hypothetical protein
VDKLKRRLARREFRRPLPFLQTNAGWVLYSKGDAYILKSPDGTLSKFLKVEEAKEMVKSNMALREQFAKVALRALRTRIEPGDKLESIAYAIADSVLRSKKQ